MAAGSGSAGTGTINIRVNLENAVQQLQKLNATLKSVSDKATTTNQKLQGLSQSLRTQTAHLRDIREATQRAVRVQNEMTTAIYGVQGQMRALNQVMQQQNQILLQLATNGRKARESYQQHQQSATSLTSSLLQLAVAFGATTSVVDIFKGSLNITKELDSINKTFYAITGTMSGANMEMGYVRQMAQNLGLDFMSLAKSYKGFSAATKFANMDLATSKEIFESVAGASTVLGLSGQKTELVLMALEQMVSKGVVSMEELRRQLGDQLPGAFELGAKAMNMGLAEFNKFVATGQLMTEDFLPRFARTLKETYATVENIGLAVKTPRAEIQKLQNELLFMQDTFARQGFLEEVIKGVRSLTAALQTEDVKQNVIALGRAFGQLVNAGLAVVQFIAEHTTLVKNLLIFYATWKISTIAMSGAFSSLQNVLTAFNMVVTANGTAIGRMSAAAGTAAGFLSRWGTVIAGMAGPIVGLAAVGTSLLLPMLDELNNKVDYSKEFADKFGVSVGEAEAQLASFLATAQKTDPLAGLNRQLAELNERLRNITEVASVGFNALFERMIDDLDDLHLADQVEAQLEEGLTALPEMANLRIINEDSLNQQTEYLKMTMQKIHSVIEGGTLTSGKAVATYLAGVRQELEKNAADTKTAWEPIFKYIEQQAVASINAIEQRQRVLTELNLKAVNADWLKMANLTDEVRASITKVGEATKNLRLGMDMEADIKSFEAVLKLVDKWYAKSEEGIRKGNESALTQIDNAGQIAEAWAETGKIKLQIEKAMQEANIATTKVQIAQQERQLKSLEDQTGAVAALIKVQISAYRELAAAQEGSLAGFDAAIASIDARVKEVKGKIPAARQALIDAQEKKIQGLKPKGSKGSKKSGGGAGKRDQTSLESLTGAADKARDALEKLQDKHTELVAKLQGESWEAQLAKVDTNLNTAVNKLTESYNKLEQRYNKMSAGPQKEAARQELETVRQLVKEQEKQLNQNAEIERQLIRIQQTIVGFSEAAESAKNAGDFTEYWAQKQNQLNKELERMPVGTSGRAAKEMEAEMARMRKEWDLLGLASQQMQNWSFNTAQSIQDDFANIIPNALDSTISAFSTMCTDILFGTSQAKDAWEAFTQAITNMGKQIINTIIQIAMKMMILKMFESFSLFGAADGAVVDNGSVITAAKGRVFGGSGVRPRAFASGGVLTSPHLFATGSGQPVVAGEAGPEAFVPLGRTRDGKLGIETTGGSGLNSNAVLIVNVYNSASDKVQTSQQQTQDANGNIQLDVFIDQIDAALGKKIGQGSSSIGRAIDRTRGTSTAKSLYA